MKKLLLGILVVLVLLVAAAVALPFVLPRDMIKAEVERRVSAELGRDFAIEGPLTLRPWRPFALTLADVRLANPDWAETPDLVRIARVELEVDALAYLGGTLALERLIVERPELALEVREDGTPSWQMGPAEATGDGRQAAGNAGGGPGELPNVRIGEVRVVDGSVSLADRSTGETRSFTAVELWARSEPDAQALAVDGSVSSAGERATLNAVVGDLNAILRGEPSSLTLDLAAPGLGVAANGEASPAGNAVLALTADMAPRLFLDWLGRPVELPAGTLETVTASVDMAAAPTGFGLRALTVRVDEMTVRGDLELALAERPRLAGRLDLGALDLRPYLPEAGPAADSAPESAAEPQGGGWPTEPLDLPLPLPLDVDLEVTLESLATREVSLGAGRATLVADAAQTAASIAELALYDGRMTGRVTLTDGEALGLDAEVDVTGVQLEPLLTELAGIDWLAGMGNVQLAVTSEGDSVDALMRGLGGQGAILARDGAILGINIGATMRQVMTLGVQSAAAEPQRTDFAEAGGTFTIASGVLDNQDFALSAPVLRVGGAGTVDLSEQSLAYRLLPRLASTLEGQDATGDAAFQAGVPLIIEGPWADPAIRLDLAGTLSGDIGDPAALAEAVRGIAADPARLQGLRDAFGIDPGSAVDGALEGLGGLLGQGESPDSGETGDSGQQAPDPAGQLMEGLGGLLRR
jgi:AsmA protein